MAASRKYAGVCIAGRDIADEKGCAWIRPVSASMEGQLREQQIEFSDHQLPQPLDIVKITVNKPFPHYYQTENYLVNEAVPWIKVGQASRDDLASWCDDVENLWIDGYDSAKGKNDRVPLEIANERISTSLLLVKADNFSIAAIDNPDGKRMTRARFSFKNNFYDLAVTDRRVEEFYAQKYAGEYSLDKVEVYLCISLGEPFEGYCYKLVAGVMTRY